MTKATKKTVEQAALEHLGIDANQKPSWAEPTFVPLDQMKAEDEGHDLDTRANSVVESSYKAKYRARAVDMTRKPKDVSLKALKRCNSDWLAVQLARLSLDGKQKLVVPAFEAILDANGVKHDHWNRTTPGWQGRLRMTGRLALQRKVAEADGELVLADGSTLKAPRTWVEKTIR